MSITIFHCTLCPKYAPDGSPEFTTDVAIIEHLDTVHQAPRPYIPVFRELLPTKAADISLSDVKDAEGRTVGVAVTVLRRGGV
jgi:hypothetical protein